MKVWWFFITDNGWEDLWKDQNLWIVCDFDQNDIKHCIEQQHPDDHHKTERKNHDQ